MPLSQAQLQELKSDVSDIVGRHAMKADDYSIPDDQLFDDLVNDLVAVLVSKVGVEGNVES